MTRTTDKYINLFTDFGFKKLFGEEPIYQESLKDYWDLKSAMDTYYKEGFDEGFGEGEKRGEERGEKKKAIETALKALDKGLPLELIQELTGLSVSEIEKLSAS